MFVKKYSVTLKNLGNFFKLNIIISLIRYYLFIINTLANKLLKVDLLFYAFNEGAFSNECCSWFSEWYVRRYKD